VGVNVLMDYAVQIFEAKTDECSLSQPGRLKSECLTPWKLHVFVNMRVLKKVTTVGNVRLMLLIQRVEKHLSKDVGRSV
jgi:hypothetical protein